MKAMLAMVFLVFFEIPSNAIPSFPGAEGFGADASGGRGGRVFFVTNANASGPGSLQEAANSPEPGYILFKVSGVIEGASITNRIGDANGNNKTFAFHTSPGGVIVKGLFYSYDSTDRHDNIIIRHMRSRYAGDDCIRVARAVRFIADHCSFAWTSDETVEATWCYSTTFQNCILGEAHPTERGHELGNCGVYIYDYYARSPFDDGQGGVTIHHNLFCRLAGRLPLITGKRNYEGEPYLPTTAEVSCNLYWDPRFMMYLNEDPCTAQLNVVNNYKFVDTVAPMLEGRVKILYPNSFFVKPENEFFLSGNGNNSAQFSLSYAWTFNENTAPYQDTLAGFGPQDNPAFHPMATMRSVRLDFPSVTYTPAGELMDYAINTMGAFPRDPMDRRFIGYVRDRRIDPTPLDSFAAHDVFDFDWTTPPMAPADADSDGMPDYWEIANDLNPSVQDHNGMELSVRYTGVEGYTNLECYLNRLSDSLVTGVSTVVTAVETRGGKTSLYSEIAARPNPFNPSVTITVGAWDDRSSHIGIFDISGRFVAAVTMRNGQGIWDASGFPSGLYLIRIKKNGNTASRPIMLMK